MSITYNHDYRSFHLSSKNMSYVLGVNKHGYLQHIYWGNKISMCTRNEHMLIGGKLYDGNAERPANIVSLHECIRNEFPTYGIGDYKSPALSVEDKKGHVTNELIYVSHKIISGKPDLEGLPSTYMESDEEGETLIITLHDKVIGLEVDLLYSCYHSRDAIIRSARYRNVSNDSLKLERAISMSVDMDNDEFDYLQLWGGWGNECNVDRKPLSHGKHVLESKRCSSSHQKNPFTALLRKDTNEDNGEAFGFNLVYSGSFISEIEVEQFEFARLNMGINPFGFSWELKPDDEFQTPEVVMVFSANGVGDMSRTYHDLYRERLCKGKFRDENRPILINNWEATYFDYDSNKLLSIAKDAKNLGVELFVLDDGWFGKRNSDASSLGDWFVNKDKIPEGIDGLATKMNELGLKFGLWVEPEMISKNSELYEKHPDWCIHIPERHQTEVRNQLMLDLSRDEVCDYIIDSVSALLTSGLVEYIKWDFNRELMEIGNEVLPAHRQKELGHRYALGLYRILDTLVTNFPHVLFEGCASGGGRFDAGILHYMSQIWASDNTDPISRLKIQHGTSIVYPMRTMGSHVSASPNHQTHRITSMKTRGNVAMAGCFGYELDTNELTQDEKDEVIRQISFYSENQSKLASADLYRIHDPITGDKSAWMFVSKDKRWACVFYVKMMTKTVRFSFERLKLKGLDTNLVYKEQESGYQYTGGELANVGMDCSELMCDFDSKIWIFTAND